MLASSLTQTRDKLGVCVFVKAMPLGGTGLRCYCGNDRTDEKTDTRAMEAEIASRRKRILHQMAFDGGLTSKRCTQEADA
jgi:hypothetical protein